ncbi:MAG: T9SS type A sorting domain-containing protein [Crocinitomicaceae bacterium]
MKLLITSFFTITLFFVFSQSMSNTTPIKVADGVGSYHPQIEITNDGQPAVIWTDDATYNLYFAKHNGTDGFLAPVKLNPDGMDVQSFNWSGPDLYIDGDNIYITFKEDGYTTGHIYLVKSADNGLTWGDTVRVDQLATGYGNYPDVAVFNDTVWVTFMDHDAGGANPQYVVARSIDGGATFEPEVAAGSLWTGEACDCCQPEIIADDQRLIVFFRNNNSNIRDIKAVVSTDRGASFSDFYSVDDHNWNIAGCPSTGPDARFMNGDKTLTAYRTSVAGEGKVFINEYNLQTNTSDDLIEITTSGGTSSLANYPQIDYKNGVIGIVWEDAGNSVDVFANFSSNGAAGLDPQNAFNVTNASGAQNKPDIAIGDNVFHMVYTDVNSGDVYYTQLRALAALNEQVVELQTLVYPQPAADYVIISFDNPEDKILQLKIYDINGKQIETNSIIYKSSQLTIPTSSLSHGVYHFELQVGDVISFGKFVVQ